MQTRKLCYNFILFILTIVAVPAFAQHELSGKITDKTTHEGIAGVNIYIEDLKIGASSDATGSFSLKNIPEGTYLVGFHAIGYENKANRILIKGSTPITVELNSTSYEEQEIVVTGISSAREASNNPQQISSVSSDYLDEHSATNIIDAIAKVPGVSAMTDGQSIAKPMIRGLGYNRVVSVVDGVVQQDQAWFDEFGIEADLNAVNRVEILKGPGSLAYGSDAIAGVINFLPEKTLPEGQIKGEVLNAYQTNNGLINNMVELAGTNNGISWSGRIDNTMAHAYHNNFDGYVLNSQFSNFNADGTIGLHRKWGYTQLHASYFDMATGIVDGTRDSATGQMVRQVAYPDLNGGAPTYELPTNQEATSYTPFCINQRIRHSKVVWDNSIAVGEGRITALFSYQKNQRQETNDPTQPNTPDIYYSSDAVTYDLRYNSPDRNGFNFSLGANGSYQGSQSLGTLMLIPNYSIMQGGGFLIANKKVNEKFSFSAGARYDMRTFRGYDHWVDSTTQQPVSGASDTNAYHEFTGFKSSFNGVSFSIGGTYKPNEHFYIKANIARGYRAPNVAECAANGVHDGTVVWEIGNHALSAEASLEEDLTIGMNGKDLSFEVDLFNNSISNFIYAKGLQSVLGGDSINNTLTVAGLGDAPVYMFEQTAAQLYGSEVMFDLHPASVSWIDFNASMSYVTGGLKNMAAGAQYLPFVPPMRITADLRFTKQHIGSALRKCYLSLGMLSCAQQSQVYLGEAAATGLNTASTPFEYAASQAATAGYVLFNAGLGADLVSHGRTYARLFIAGTNLLNTTYMDYMSRYKYYPVNYTTDRVGVFNMGRNVSLKVIIPLDIKG